MEALDRLFENVCELDLIFNFETLHAALGEMIVGGVVIETQVCSYLLVAQYFGSSVLTLVAGSCG